MTSTLVGPTQYAVHCPVEGKRYLTYTEYTQQLRRADNMWACPSCGRAADWDDDNYEYWQELIEDAAYYAAEIEEESWNT